MACRRNSSPSHTLVESVAIAAVTACTLLAPRQVAAGEPHAESAAIAPAGRHGGGKRGFLPRSFKDQSGAEHRYLIFLPHGYRPGDRPPVLLFLNGLGENGDDGIKQISNNFGQPVWEMRPFFPFLAVMPQCRKGGSWTPGGPEVQSVLQILDSVVGEFEADEERVFLTGVSAGGGGVWSVGSVNTERFAGLVPLCGGGGESPSLTQQRMPIWNFYNEQDLPGLVESNRKSRAALMQSGLSPLFTEYPAVAHDCWNRAYRCTALYGWLLEQSRSRMAREQIPFEPLPAARILQEWERQGAGDWMADKEEALAGLGPSDGESLLIAPTASSGFEFHADAWIDDEGACRVALLAGPNAGSGTGLRLELATSAQGTGGVSDPGGRWLARLDPAAQRTLRAGAWNDVRVRFANGRLTAHLNGWSALDLDAGREHQGEHRFAFVTPGSGAAVRWRFVRKRQWNHDAPRDLENATATEGRSNVADAACQGDWRIFPGHWWTTLREAWNVGRIAAGKMSQSPSGDRPPSNVPDERSASADLSTILAEWKRRESRRTGGQSEWRLERQNRSATFGKRPTDEASLATGPWSTPIRIAFSRDTFRFDGSCVPTLWEENLSWEEAFPGRFSLPDYFEVFQPYTVLCDRQSAIHLWGGGSDASPRALRFEINGRDRLLDAGRSSEPAGAPVLTGLLEAFRWGVRPSTQVEYERAEERFRVLPVQPAVDGKRCLAVEEQFAEDRAGSRQLWIDPSPGGFVMRCIVFDRHAAVRQQYDIEYDDGGEDRLPARLTVLSMGPFGDPYDEVAAARQSFVDAEPRAETFTLSLPEGEWVADAARDREYFSRADGVRPPTTYSKMMARESPEGAHSPPPVVIGGGRRAFGANVGGAIFGMVTWPGILVTLPALFGATRMARAVRRRKGVRIEDRRAAPMPPASIAPGTQP